MSITIQLSRILSKWNEIQFHQLTISPRKLKFHQVSNGFILTHLFYHLFYSAKSTQGLMMNKPNLLDIMTDIRIK